MLANRTMTCSRSRTIPLLLSLPLALLGCSGDDGDDGAQGPPGDDGGGGQVDNDLDRDQDPPGVHVEILSVQGATGAGGTFRVGDKLKLRFTIKMDDGTDWPIEELTRGRTLVSGPTFNYQRVIAEQTDLLTASVANADGSYTYTYSAPIPATYLPPVNDTASFGPGDGELTGQSLLGGTYSVGLYFRWDYTVGTESYSQVGDTVTDFLFGGATQLEPRAVTSLANCNQCHGQLEAHGGNRKDVRLCLLCHTAGAEDRNNPNVEGGTPGASVDFGVMIHKIHSGEHLPSVNGVATNPDGSRNYDAPPEPYILMGFGDNIIDFSAVGFPVWPNLSFALPRDLGYTALTTTQKAQEDLIRTGPAGCAACHGDPDADGPLEAPDQGDVIYSELSRAACGACHDDVDWTQPYTANGSTMPAQNDDATCTLCHDPSGTPLAVLDAHLHPILDPTFNPGLFFEVLSVAEAGTNDGDGTIDAGEKVELTFTIQDSDGADVDPTDIAAMSTVVSGPTYNHNLLLYNSFPPAALSGAQPYVMNLPALVQLERVGITTGGADSFTTSRAPHWNVTGALTAVWARTATAGGSDSLDEDAEAPSNYLDLGDATGFDRNDYVVIDDGTPEEEYLRIQWVDGDRLWFSSPYSSGYAAGLRFDHLAGATVEEVTLTALTEGVEYSLDEATGQIDEIAFTSGQVIVVSYTSDFVAPDTYPLALNSSPDLDEAHGKWTGKSLADGTYTAGIWGNRSLSLVLHGETNSYNAASEAGEADFLVGSATSTSPYDKIESADACLACHKELMFHGGGRRGFTACILCHGTAGSEDRPRYVAPGAPDTTGLMVNFREMLHKIHMGEHLAYASTYTVVGFGSPSNYPNNFSESHYDEVVFPVLPEGVKDCSACHGDSNDAWHDLADREHPTEQTVPVLEWTIACGACHDSDSAQAHIELQTTQGGQEACAVCHSGSDELSVEVVHKPR